MKKLLSILSSLGLISVASASVVACGSSDTSNGGNVQKQKKPEFKSLSYSDSEGELILIGNDLDDIQYNNLSLESSITECSVGITIIKSDKASLKIKLSSPLKFYDKYTLTYTSSDLSYSKSISFEYSGKDAQIYSANINDLGDTITIYGVNLTSIENDNEVKVSYLTNSDDSTTEKYLSGLTISKEQTTDNCLVIKSDTPISYQNYKISIGNKDTQKYAINYVSKIEVMAIDYKPYDEKDVELFLHGSNLDLMDGKSSSFEIKSISEKAVVPDGEQITVKNIGDNSVILQLNKPLGPTEMPEGEEDETLTFELTIIMNGRTISKIQFDAKTEIQNPGGNTAPDDENPVNPDNPPFNPNN